MNNWKETIKVNNEDEELIKCLTVIANFRDGEDKIIENEMKKHAIS